jgi:capsular polysaccharide biosynthesis protein
MRDRVVEMKEEVESLRKEYQENSLATEMLRELKAQNKRQHITIIVLIAVIVAMIIGFFIYENQYETVTESEMATNSSEKPKLMQMAQREKEHHKYLKEMIEK